MLNRTSKIQQKESVFVL